ncbi:ROK family transcriptional regulator [Luteococcus peritonei]
MAAMPEGLDATSRLVALTLLRRGPRSRAELCRELGLSSASLTRLTRPMLEAGILSEGDPVAPLTTGRPSLPLSLVPGAAHVVGVKLVTGRAHLVLTDLSATVLDRLEVDDELDSPERAAQVLARALDRWADHRPSGLGISLGADVDRDGRVGSAPFLGWPASRLPQLVQQATGLPAVAGNDVNALAVAEHWFGAGRELSDFAVITVGMGIGLGLVCNDQMVPGHDGRAGMVGRMCLPGGTAGELLADRALAARLGRELGEAVSVEDLPLLASRPEAAGVLRAAARDLGHLAAQVGMVSAPRRVLVTGEGIGLLIRHQEEVLAGLQELAGPGAPELVLEELEFSEWARGAACLAIRELLAG